MSNLRDYETQGGIPGISGPSEAKYTHQFYRIDCTQKEFDKLNSIEEPFGGWKPKLVSKALRELRGQHEVEEPEAPLVKSQLDIQEGGSHYKDMAIQPVQYITANNIPFMEGNVIKYVSRHKAKNGAADIKKAIHFLNLILELQYGDKS